MVDNFEQWIDSMYGYPNIGYVKSARGKFHDYSVITLDCITKGEVKNDMWKYVKNIIDELPNNIEKHQSVTSLETNNMFKLGSRYPMKKKSKLFYTHGDRGLFFFKIERLDIHITIAV